jgi:hypothetical protein
MWVLLLFKLFAFEIESIFGMRKKIKVEDGEKGQEEK